MGIPVRVMITLAMIVGIGAGTGMLTFGILLELDYRDEHAGLIAFGGTLLSASVAAMVAHLAGGFRDLDDGEP